MKKLLLAALMVPAIGSFAQVQRVPLYEVFTSSTCGPCNPGNAVYEGVVGAKPANEYVTVKYQQNFPGTGDPYCTAETKSRRSSYYSINSIPRMEADGGWDKNAQSFTEALYNQFKAVPAKFLLSGAFTYTASSKTITAKVDCTPKDAAAITGAKLYVVILEGQTTKNKKSNGETIFHNVVKKMLPNQNGTSLTGLVIDQNKSTTLSFKFNGNYRLPVNGLDTSFIDDAAEHSVEDFNNLKVVAWVQGPGGSAAGAKDVYQAANLMKVNSLGLSEVTSTMADVTVFPNPAVNNVNISFTTKEADNISALIINLEGEIVVQKTMSMAAGKNQISLNTANLANGYYNLVVFDSKNNSFTEKLTVVH